MRIHVGIAFALLIVFVPGLFSQTTASKLDMGRDYGRSMVVSRGGIVATSQTLASTAGADILRQGGSAVDAAIAANAVLNVAEPMMNGIGGDLFAIVYDAKTKKLYGLNSSGWAPNGLSIDFLKAHGITKTLPRKSIYSVTVPGAVAGWDALHKRFGKLTWTVCWSRQFTTPKMAYRSLRWSLGSGPPPAPSYTIKRDFGKHFCPEIMRREPAKSFAIRISPNRSG